MTTDRRPDELEQRHLEYLDALRESGATNMFGARPWLQGAFPQLTKSGAAEILSWWMLTFSDRHPRKEGE